jgi:hypothetical protein
MKTLKKIGFMFVMAAVSAFIFTACGTDEASPKPKVTFDSDVSAGYTFADAEVTVGTLIKIGVIATSEVNIKTVEMHVSDGTNTDLVYDTTLNEKQFTDDIFRNASANIGTETWTVTVTDKDGNSASRSLKITTKKESDSLSIIEDEQVFNIIGPNHGAYDLVASATRGVGDPAAQKDIVDQTTTSTFSREWGTLNGSEFIRLNSGALQQFVLEDDIITRWNANSGSATSTLSNLDEGDLILCKSGQAGQYYVIALHTIMDGAGNDDYYQFDYKGAF